MQLGKGKRQFFLGCIGRKCIIDTKRDPDLPKKAQVEENTFWWIPLSTLAGERRMCFLRSLEQTGKAERSLNVSDQLRAFCFKFASCLRQP